MNIPLSCAACRQSLPWYVAGTLAAGERAASAGHLITCDACTRELAAWQALAASAQTAAATVAPIPPLATSWQSLASRLPAVETTVPAYQANAVNAATDTPRSWHTLATQGRHLWMTWRAQRILLHGSFWYGTAAGVALAVLGALLWPSTAGGANLAVFLFPVIASAGMVFLSTPTTDAQAEIALATPTSPRIVLLSRVCLIIGFNAMLALIGTGVIASLHGVAFMTLLARWLGPLLLFSAAGFALAATITPLASLAATSGWALLFLHIHQAIMLQPPVWMSLPGALVSALLASAIVGGTLLARPQPLLATLTPHSPIPIAALLQRRDQRSMSTSVPDSSRPAKPHAAMSSPQASTSPAVHQFIGVCRYEFIMQVRRVAFWVIFILVGAIAIINFITPQNITHNANLPVTRAHIVIEEAAGMATLALLGVGLSLAGRVWRDRATKVVAVLDSTPTSMLTRLVGKFIGNVVATLLPIAAIYILGFGLLFAQWGDASFILLALAGFALLVLPAILFVGAFTIAFNTFLWTPLYQFLFIGYFLWESLQPNGPIPTLDGTVLSPSGRLIMTGIFDFTPFRVSDNAYYPHATVGLGIANFGVLVLAAGVALLAGWGIQRWQARAA